MSQMDLSARAFAPAVDSEFEADLQRLMLETEAISPGSHQLAHTRGRRGGSFPHLAALRVRRVQTAVRLEETHPPVPHSPTPAARRPTDEQIAARAHQISLARRGEPGNPVVDWLEAEHQLLAEANAQD